MARKNIAAQPVVQEAALPAAQENAQPTASPPAPTVEPVRPALESVRVRMYRQGWGDCFLLSFPGAASGDFHVLIDCGVILGTKEPEKIMGDVARDLAAACGGRLDVVVATHEHWDHVSGFLQAKEIFDEFKIGEVWLPWTEDPADELASRLREGQRRTLSALRAVASRLTGLNATAAVQVDAMLEFFGAAASGGTARDALAYLAAHPSKPKVRYCRPGDAPRTLPGIDGARVFVLGPPHDEALLKRGNPTKSDSEVYEFAVDGETAFLAAATRLGVDDAEATRLGDAMQAFEPRYRLTADQAQTLPLIQNYSAPQEAWRKIDGDWLNASGRLGLTLDSDTNNTSLALAFELKDGRVLLFPGDAQVGNWLSWPKCAWPTVAGVTGADLLRRTVLYKVGHHASHNATPRAGGLELMESPDLVALIPVDHDMAVRKRWPGMPFPSLLSRLLEKARGRVLRIDQSLPNRPASVDVSVWEEFRRRVTETPLYFDYHVGG